MPAFGSLKTVTLAADQRAEIIGLFSCPLQFANKDNVTNFSSRSDDKDFVPADQGQSTGCVQPHDKPNPA